MVNSPISACSHHRGQLHPIDQARIARRLFEIEKRRSPGSLRPGELAAARDRVGKILGQSGRNLERYFHLLNTPQPIQNAVRDGWLKLVTGSKIASLPKSVQESIAGRIAGLDDPAAMTAVVAEHVFVPDGRRHEKLGDAVATLVRNLEKGAADLGDRVDRVSPTLAAQHLPALTQASTMITKLMQRAGEAKTGPSLPDFAGAGFASSLK